MSTLIQQFKDYNHVPQNTFCFKITILFNPAVPAIEPKYFSFLAKSSVIPTKEREAIVYRVSGDKQYTVPCPGILTDPTWNVSFYLMEKDESYNHLLRWFYNIDNLPLEALKSYAWVDLMNLNEEVNRRLFVRGIYPKKTPDIGELNYEGVDNYIVFEMPFAIDDIDYDGVPFSSAVGI